MSATEAAQRRQAAADAWRASMAEGAPMSAAQLGQLVGRSRSWARQVIAETVAADHSNGHGQPPAAVESETGDEGGAQEAGELRAATWQRTLTGLAVVVVAAVAAAISYSHLQALALSAGEGAWQAAILPLSVDGMMLCASLTAITRRRAGQPVGALPWLALLLGVAASVAANIASAEPTVEGRLIAAWPPVALLLSLELLLRQRREP